MSDDPDEKVRQPVFLKLMVPWFRKKHQIGPAHDSVAEQRDQVLVAYSRQLVAATGAAQVAQALFRAVDDLTSVDQCALLAVDEQQEHATVIATVTGHGAPVSGLVIDLEDDSSAVSRVVRDRTPHRVVDGDKESLHHSVLADELSLKSALYVPLQTSAGVIGVLVAGMTANIRVFRREEVEIISRLANDAAVALERARFAQALRDVGERELVVASVARSIRESLKPEQIAETAARELVENVDATRVQVQIIPGRDLGGHCRTWPRPDNGVRGDNRYISSPGIELAVDRRQTVIGRCAPDAPNTTEIVIPLVQRESVLGTVLVQRENTSFEQPEIRLIELVAVELAAALEHARLYQAGRTHLHEQLALARAAQSLTADLKFENVIRHIVEEVVKLLDTTSGAFYVYDRDAKVLTLSAAHGEVDQGVVGETMEPIGLAGRVVTSGVSQMTNNYVGDLGNDVHPVFREIRRAIAVPVRWQGDLRGVVSVATTNENSVYDDHHVALLEAFADLASLALHNAEAYSAHGRQARIQAGFYRISQILSSTLSRSETLASLAQAATDALDASWGFVLCESAEGFSLAARYLVPDGFPPDLEEGSPLELPASELARLALDHDRVITVANLAEDTRFQGAWTDHMVAAGVRSVLAVPINVPASESAAVVVCFEGSTKFNDELLVIANNVAGAARAALERAGLFENEQRMRHLNEVLADINAQLAETLKAQNVLEHVVEQAASLLGCDACALALVDTQSERLKIHAVGGSDEQMVGMLETSQPGGLIEEVASSGRTVLIGELAGDAEARGGAVYEAFLGVPLKHPRGHMIGVLAVYAGDRRNWQAAEARALESLASSSAIAIRNADLYSRVKSERDTNETLVESIAEGIVATDVAGRITIWNHAARQITGVSADEALGQHWRDVLGVTADIDVPGGDRKEQVVAARPKGVPMWLSISTSHVSSGSSDVPHLQIHTIRDISAHHTLDRLRDDFLATVSYVLRTPLAAIHGFAQTLLRDDMDISEEDRKIFLSFISSETSRISGIVDDLVEVAKIEAGKVNVKVHECSLDAVLQNVAAPLKKVHEHLLEPADDTGLLVLADPDMFNVAIENILKYALVMAQEGNGKVHVSVSSSGEMAFLRILETGSALTPAERKLLFSKFYSSAGVKAGPAGLHSGLGLYIARALISAMGGRVFAEGGSGGIGTLITIELPLSRKEALVS